MIEKLVPVITTVVKQDSLVEKIDSISIWKVDTLSDAKYAERHVSNQFRKVDLYLSMSKSYSSQAELDASQAKLNRQQASLYGGILESTTLERIATEDAEKNLKDFKENYQKSKLYLDSAQVINKEATALDNKLKTKKINDKNFRGYLIHFKILGSDKRNIEVRKDSMYIYISPALRVIPYNAM